MNLTMRSRIVVSSVILALALAVGFLGTEVISSARDYPNAYAKGNLLRLHVIANSDSAFDQELKLAVRDAILTRTGELFLSARDKEEAREVFLAHEQDVRDAALSVIHKWGKDYDVRFELGEFDFPEKSYGDLTLAAGTYDALRVVIGSGSGRNWWCVLFPPLCLIDSEGTSELVPMKEHTKIGRVPVQFRFKYADVAEDIQEKVAQVINTPLKFPGWATGLFKNVFGSEALAAAEK